jgi:hypothetical protein
VYKYKSFHLYSYGGIHGAMETVPGAQPEVTGFVLAQLRRLSDEAGRLEGMARVEGGGAAIAEAIDRLRHRLAAHVRVEERLFTSPLRGSPWHRGLLALEDAHEALEHRAAEVHSQGCPPLEVAALGRALRVHIEEECRVVLSASAAAASRLAGIAAWRADDLFECAGGPTETWPGEWLG